MASATPLPPGETSDMQPRHPPAPGPLPIVAALLAAAVLAQLLLGDGLGVHDAWMALLLAVALFAILVVADARPARAGSAQETYDLTTVALAALAIGAAVACLYLPLPWGGLGAAAVLVALLGALRLNGRS
jgi:hypothetical protein